MSTDHSSDSSGSEITRKRRRWPWVIASFASLAMAVIAFGYTLAPSLTMSLLNRVAPEHVVSVNEEAAALHASLLVVDMHADATLWNRDLLARDTRGHVDVPRLLEGNIALQGFTAATRIPAQMNIEATPDKWDVQVPLTFFQRWPSESWTSAFSRALYQAQRLHDAAAGSNGKLHVIKTRADLDAYLEKREQEKDITAGWLGLEGLHCLEGKLENLDALYDAGFRMMAPTHFFDNFVGGSAHGLQKYGLTEFGGAIIEKMQEKGILIDLAHASPKVIEDTLALATTPVVVSHTGVRGTCDNNRNLTDEQLRAIAATGGVIGIGFWDTAVCGTSVQAIVDAIMYSVGVVGADHVALGSDWDGATVTPFDAAGVPQLTQGLLDAGMGEGDIRKVMGENTLRVLREVLS